MSIVSSYTNIANAIRSKTGKTSAITPAQMVTEIGTLAVSPETCSTVAELESKLIASNEGKLYLYTGASSVNYLADNCYIVEEGAQMLPIGGRVFYVDNTSSGGSYAFYDAEGNELSTQTVEGLDGARYYIKTGSPDKDKFYVADSVNCLRKYDGKYECIWSLATEDLSSYADVFDVLSEPNAVVGTGKRNTLWVSNNKNNSDYYPYHNGSTNRITCWDFAKICNDNSVNGCNDWYAPSIAEVIQLRNSGIWGLSTEEWMGTVSSRFQALLWSSSTKYDIDNSWLWFSGEEWGRIYDQARGISKSQTRYEQSIVAVRSF